MLTNETFTRNVAAGETVAWPLSTGSTNLGVAAHGGFQGYIIAQCRFQYAHGFAFITKVGGVDLAEGYLALVIPDPPRSANPFPCAGGTACNGGSGEQLGY